jgi:hypothetical protein
MCLHARVVGIAQPTLTGLLGALLANLLAFLTPLNDLLLLRGPLTLRPSLLTRLAPLRGGLLLCLLGLDAILLAGLLPLRPILLTRFGAAAPAVAVFLRHRRRRHGRARRKQGEDESLTHRN